MITMACHYREHKRTWSCNLKRGGWEFGKEGFQKIQTPFSGKQKKSQRKKEKVVAQKKNTETWTWFKNRKTEPFISFLQWVIRCFQNISMIP